ncbi:MAG: ComEC/Rec2 family competence protein [Thermoleophilia bacterium]
MDHTAPAPRAPLRLRLAPHLLAGCLCAGLVAPLAVPVDAALAGVGCALAGAAALWVTAARRPAAALALLALTALLGGAAWGEARVAGTAPPALDLSAAVAGTVIVDTPPVPDARGGRRARGVVERLDGPVVVPAGTRILLELDGADPPRVGTRLRVEGRLRPAASGTSPGWWRRWLARQGIAGRLRPAIAVEAGSRGGAAGVRDRWRAWAGEAAGAGLAGDVRALVRGMALGGGSELSEPAQEAFRDAGVWHLLAVSGQNVTVVALTVLVGLTALGVRRRPAVAGAGLAMVAYCLACDGGASVARAGIVGALGLAAELRSAPRERWHLLLAGLALLLAHQPRAIEDPGLQLSFAAVAGLFALAPPLEGWFRGWLPGRVAGLAAAAAAAGLATAPVVVANFGRLSLAGLVVNVVAVPLAAPVVVLALAGIAAGAVLPAAGVVLAWAAGAGAWLLLALARAAAAVPGAAVDLPSAAALPVAAVPAAAVLLASLLRPGAPGPGAAARRWGRPAVAVVVALLAAGWALGRPPAPQPWPGAPAVTALDVGQGDAILLRSPDGAAVLVDAGPPGAGEGEAPVAGRLGRLGVRRLDALVLTHDSLDHVGGARDVLGAVQVGRLLMPPEPADGWAPHAEAVRADARDAGVPVGEAAAGDALAAGAWRLRVLAPSGARPAGADPNPWSLVVRATAGDLSALLTADAESDALAALPAGTVDVLKVSHHGSEDPGLPPLLARLRPRVALVSAGEGNPFGHPRAPTLDALAATGAATWRTDRAGDVTVTGGAGAPAVTAERPSGRPQ